jgi:hypothetical protein
MRVENITPLALETIHEVHRASGFDYQFPKDFSTPLFPLRRCVVDDAGKFVGAFALKVEAEVYLWMDHEYGTPEQRWEAIELLSADGIERARLIGFDQVHCVLPPEMAERFGKRLQGLGWIPSRPWPLYVLQLR